MLLETVIAKVRGALRDRGFEVSRPYVNERSSINIVARNDDRLILVKALKKMDELKTCCSMEIKKASYALKASPIVVSEGEEEEIDEEAVYEKYGVYILHPNTLKSYLEDRKQYVYYKGGRFYARINGEKLREIRERVGLSLGGLAGMLGITRKAVYEYERNEMDAAIDVAAKLYDILKDLVGEGEAIQAFKPVDILGSTAEFKAEEGVPTANIKFKGRKFQEEVTSKLLTLGFSVLKFREAPFNLIAKRNNDKRKTILILAVEALNCKTKEEAEFLRDAAELAEVKELVITRKEAREEGIISSKMLEGISSAEELIEVTEP
ncbi:MAG: helix-turn-helix domain-containing protein [Candidatus Nezhaarchaeota archaeon]|nr:helix-turn-helix domain-containing protein [Candidatus Nezhaarchaeota archaeon]